MKVSKLCINPGYAPGAVALGHTVERGFIDSEINRARLLYRDARIGFAEGMRFYFLKLQTG